MNRIIRLLAVAGLAVAGCTAVPVTSPTGLTFIHLNDTYRVGAVEDDSRGGFSRVVTLVRDLHAEGREVRLLHGGDFLYPSLESQLWNGLQMVDAMNFMNAVAPLYVVAGNHEFDRRTPEHLVNAVKASEFFWLADNYRFMTGDPGADDALASRYTFRHHGRTIGLFGLTLHGADGGNERDYVQIDRDYVAAAESAIRELEAAGADLIVGVTHLHLWQDMRIAALRAEHPAFAFIVGGHEHEPQYVPGSATSAIVMKGASNARVVWRIDVDFAASGQPSVQASRIEVDRSIAFDPDYEVLATKWRDRLLEKFPFLEARIGTATLAMDAREEYIRSRESSWGNFIVDQMRGAFGEPAADFAFINSGTLRLDDVVEDDIRFEDLGRTFGFSSFLRHTRLTGAEFRRVLEAGFRGEGDASQGYFPQVSGFRLCVDRSLPVGQRIVSLQVPTPEGWREIEDGREYTLVVPDFLYGGGDGYEVPKDRFASRPASELKYLVLDAIFRAQGQGRTVGAPVDPSNPRIVTLREPKQPCFP